MANAAELVIVGPRRDRMGESVFLSLKLIELKRLPDSRETTQTQDIDFQHRGRAVTNNVVRLNKKSVFVASDVAFSA